MNIYMWHVTCYIYVQVEEIELKPNGGDIDVVEENKREYVKWVNLIGSLLIATCFIHIFDYFQTFDEVAFWGSLCQANGCNKEGMTHTEYAVLYYTVYVHTCI